MFATIRIKNKFYNDAFYRYFSILRKIRDYKKYYQILGIPENSDQEQIRKAYLDLVKKYHPDSGTEYADAEKFQMIDEAFKILLNRKSKERWDILDNDNVMEQDIKHTAPQHRQYLSYGGIGTGTPFQREKEYVKARAVEAAENVLQHRMSKVSAEEKALLDKSKVSYKHKIKTKYGFERLVEDLIQESMSKGEFSNLSGTGKPLPQHQNTNPYVDFVTHKLNQVLIDNGFTPEWITLQKEIREELELLRDSLASERKYFGPHPLNATDRTDWDDILKKYKKLTDDINKKISKFNLLVPMMNKQMVLLDLLKESDKVLINGNYSSERLLRPVNANKVTQQINNDDNSNNLILGLLHSIFKK